MTNNLVLNLSAVAALLPLAITAVRSHPERRDGLYWTCLAVALTGPTALCVIHLSTAPWDSGISIALWISIAASLWTFVAASLLSANLWRLTVLLMPYLILLALLATVWSGVPSGTVLASEVDVWLQLHIVSSVATYALSTIAAMAAAAVYLKERDLKLKRGSRLARLLPAVTQAEALQIRLLSIAEAVLLLGIVSGMARGYVVDGHLLSLDHKTLLSFIAFALIGVLLLLQWRSGIYGKQAARLVLMVYLLLTLSYPGVKFVLDILLV